jgi:hypothetical protein
MKDQQPPGTPPGRKGRNPDKDVSWERLRAVFSALIELPAEERWASLAQLTDEPLRQEVASLLKAHEQAGGFLDPGDATRVADVRNQRPKTRRRRPR